MTDEQIKKREIILGIVGCKYMHGSMEKFGGLSIGRFEQLISDGFLSPRDQETYPKFLRFMKKYNQFRAFGYAISPDRHDSRVVIQGLESFPFYKLPPDVVEEFKREFANAKELTVENNRYTCLFEYEGKQ